VCVCVKRPNFLYRKRCVFSTLLHHISSLFLNETKTVLADATSHSLFRLGLGVKNFHFTGHQQVPCTPDAS